MNISSNGTTFTQRIMLDFRTRSQMTACVFYLDLEKSVEVCYTYDKLSRVKERETVSLTGGSSSCEGFIYDAAGNVTQSSKDEPGSYSSTRYTYDSLTNRLASYDGCTPTYDADGNMRRQTFDFFHTVHYSRQDKRD